MVTKLEILETYYEKLKLWRSHIDPKVIRAEMIQTNKDIRYYRKIKKRRKSVGRLKKLL